MGGPAGIPLSTTHGKRNSRRVFDQNHTFGSPHLYIRIDIRPATQYQLSSERVGAVKQMPPYDAPLRATHIPFRPYLELCVGGQRHRPEIFKWPHPSGQALYWRAFWNRTVHNTKLFGERVGAVESIRVL